MGRFRSPGLALSLVWCAAAAWLSPCAVAQTAPRIVATPDTVLFDQPVAVRITGLAPGDTATLRTSATDATGRAFASSARFVADARGEVDLGREAPVGGDYAGVEPMGLFWSMAPAAPPPFFYRAFEEMPLWLRRRFPRADTVGTVEGAATRIDVAVGGRVVASTTVLRRFVPAGTRITRVRERGLYGFLYEPPGAGPHPAVLALTGSSGGIVPWWALLAGHGYTTFALTWLDAPGTAQQLTDVPVEYFDTALAWLRARPGVDTARMGVLGWSLGGEATLLVASMHPELKAAVALAGSPVVWEGILHDSVTNAVLARPTGRSTWTYGGAPLPFATRKWSALPPGVVSAPAGSPRELPNADNFRMYVATLQDTAQIARGTMPLERSRAAFLLLGARDDEAWPSAALAQIAIDRLKRAGYAHPYEQAIYEVGGHGVALPAYTPVGGLRPPTPALAAKIAHNRADAWARELRFLDEHLAHAGTRVSAASAPPGQCRVGAAASPLELATDRGLVRGVADEGVVAWLGIPFAAPPTGALRWKRPQPADCWSGVLEAKAYGAPCPQPWKTPTPQDEACLTLNVWAPADRRAGERLPILLYLHGGGNTNGSASALLPGTTRPLYDGAPLAARGRVVVVEPQYRLGWLGFLAHPALDAEAPGHSSGNYGLLDQVAALEWVRRNAAAFGGDTARVLLFGQSAGGKDVCALLGVSAARGLFSRAAVLSGNCIFVPPLARMEDQGRRAATAAGCADDVAAAACLRAKPAAELARITFPSSWVQEGFQLGPTVDGRVLPAHPLAALGAGGRRVPLLIGNAEDEFGGPLMDGVWRDTVRTPADYERAVRSLFGDSLAPRVLARYPAAATAPRMALVHVLSDAQHVCLERQVARAVAAAGAPVWRYLWTHTTARGLAHPLGAAHVTDVPFWFGTQPDSLRTAAEDKLSHEMMDYLVAFARSGDPNHPGAARWPRWDPARDAYLRLDDVVTAAAGVHTAQCDFWDSLRARPASAAAAARAGPAGSATR